MLHAARLFEPLPMVEDDDPPQVRRRARRDALPEDTTYQDHGCDVAPSCLACPLSRCRYDTPGGKAAIMREDRDAEILRIVSARRNGGINEAAQRFGVSRRTIFRVLAMQEIRKTVRKTIDTRSAWS